MVVHINIGFSEKKILKLKEDNKKKVIGLILPNLIFRNWVSWSLAFGGLGMLNLDLKD